MNKIDESKVNALIHRIGLKHNLRDIEVKQIVESQFRFMFEQIKSVKLDDIKEDEVDTLKTNFFLKYLGKIHTSPARIKGVIKRKQKNKEIYETDSNSGNN